MKVSPLVLLPVLVLSLALLPASRGELGLFCTEATATRQKVASLISSQQGPATERPVPMAQTVPARRSAKDLKGRHQA